MVLKVLLIASGGCKGAVQPSCLLLAASGGAEPFSAPGDHWDPLQTRLTPGRSTPGAVQPQGCSGSYPGGRRRFPPARCEAGGERVPAAPPCARPRPGASPRPGMSSPAANRRRAGAGSRARSPPGTGARYRYRGEGVRGAGGGRWAIGGPAPPEAMRTPWRGAGGGAAHGGKAPGGTARGGTARGGITCWRRRGSCGWRWSAT